VANVQLQQANKSFNEHEFNSDFLSQFDFSQSDATSSQIDVFQSFLIHNKPAFSQHDDDIGFTSMVKHKINLADATPFKQRYQYIPQVCMTRFVPT
jgi:hypothetical protein